MQSKAIITSCSNKFFPSVINLITSIKANYPNHPPIFVYNLGLLRSFRYELEHIEGVTVVAMPVFCPHWRSCYTWKTHIFAHPLADLNFYLDAGCQVIHPLDTIFEHIAEHGYYLFDVSFPFNDMIPVSYLTFLDFDPRSKQYISANAGIAGFAKVSPIMNAFKQSYQAALAGLSLGFSPRESWRNKYPNKSSFVRDCTLFRHDQTLLNLFARKELGDDLRIDLPKFCLTTNNEEDIDQAVWHLRLSYKKLEHTTIKDLHSVKRYGIFYVNRLLIKLITIIKRFLT